MKQIFFMLVVTILFFNFQTKSQTNRHFSQDGLNFYLSLSGGHTSFGDIEEEIEEATIEAGGIFFNNNTEELTEFSQNNSYNIGLIGGILFSKNFFCDLEINYSPGLKGEYTCEDLQQDAIFTTFNYNLIYVFVSPGYYEFLSNNIKWSASVGAGYGLANKEIIFYGMAFGHVGSEFDRVEESNGAFCVSASLGVEYFVFDSATLFADIKGIQHFGCLKNLNSVNANAGIKYIF